jgi:aldose sugar dehydrogenase
LVYDNSTGHLQSQPLISLSTTSTKQRGLLGIAVDPDFATNGYVYASYVASNNFERLSRLTVTDPRAAVLTVDPASEVVLKQGNQPAAEDHLGGTVRFAPDGTLFWSVGNNDYYTGNYVISNNAQDLTNIYGKILHINPDGSVPEDNPFIGTPLADPYIYAYGFRNPFRMTFTPTGQLLVGDVGESAWEEINNVAAGGNYGWPLAEGPCSGVGTESCSTPSQYDNPAYAYPHVPGVSSSITGVMAYSGTAFATGQNSVFFADFNRGFIEQVTCTAGYSSCGSPSMFISNAGATDQLVEGPDGNIYQLTYLSDIATFSGLGSLSRISPAADV